MGGRRRGRIIAVQSLYRHDLSGAGLDELLDFSWIDGERPAALADETAAFARLLIQGTLENLAAVDAAIRRHLEHWDFTRLATGRPRAAARQRVLPACSSRRSRPRSPSTRPSTSPGPSAAPIPGGS